MLDAGLSVDQESLGSVFLASELQAEQMVSSKPAADAEELDASLQDFRVICEVLKLPDPSGRDARDTFSAVEQQVRHSLHVDLQLEPFKASFSAGRITQTRF